MNVQSIVRFSGYNPPLPAGTPAILLPGELVEIYAQGRDDKAAPIAGGWMVRAVADPTRLDTTFEGKEITEVSEEEAVAARHTLNLALAQPAQPVVAPVAPVAPATAPVVAPPVKKVKAPKAAPAAPVAGAPAPSAAPAKPAKAPKPPKAPKPEKAPKPVKVVPEKPELAPIVDTPLITSLIGGNALAAARKLVEDKATNDYAIGGVLSFIMRNKTYLTILNVEGTGAKYADAPESFDAYLKDELGMTESYRVARFKIAAYEGVARLGLSPEDEAKAIALGYTKLKDLVRLLTPENASLELTAAATKSSKEIQQEVKTRLKAIGSTNVRDTVEMTHFNFRLFSDQGTNAKLALEDAKGKVGQAADGKMPTDSEAFHYICSEYVERMNTSAITLEVAMEALGARYGVTLAIAEAPAAEAEAVAQ